MLASPTPLSIVDNHQPLDAVALELGTAQARLIAELAAQVAALALAREVDRHIIEELVAEREAARLPQFITIKQAAALCAVSPKTMHQWTRLPPDARRHVPTVRFSETAVRIEQGVFLAWLERQGRPQLQVV